MAFKYPDWLDGFNRGNPVTKEVLGDHLLDPILIPNPFQYGQLGGVKGKTGKEVADLVTKAFKSMGFPAATYYEMIQGRAYLFQSPTAFAEWERVNKKTTRNVGDTLIDTHEKQRTVEGVKMGGLVIVGLLIAGLGYGYYRMKKKRK